jgi:hypothetical protein
MCGQEGLYGTASFQVVLDLEEMRKLESTVAYEKQDEDEAIEKMMGGLEDPDDACSNNKLVIQNNVSTIKTADLGEDNDYNPGF